MTFKKILGKEKSESPHPSLHGAFVKEVEAMREVLANLHQEELSLLEGNFRKWGSLMEERSDLVLELKQLREKRMDLTKALVHWVVSKGNQELLPSTEETSCSIFNQLDQVIALMERINLQNARNDALFYQAQQKKELPLDCPFPHPHHLPKKKTTVKTKTSFS